MKRSIERAEKLSQSIRELSKYRSTSDIKIQVGFWHQYKNSGQLLTLISKYRWTFDINMKTQVAASQDYDICILSIEMKHCRENVKNSPVSYSSTFFVCSHHCHWLACSAGFSPLHWGISSSQTSSPTRRSAWIYRVKNCKLLTMWKKINLHILCRK